MSTNYNMTMKRYNGTDYDTLYPATTAGQIISGTLSADRIPELAASKITSGTFAAARIPNLDASKITSGTLPIARGGTGATTAANACSNIGAVKKSGDTMTGDLQINKINPSLILEYPAYSRRSWIESGENSMTAISNGSITDPYDNRSFIALESENTSLEYILQLATAKNGVYSHYNILHTGNYSNYVVPKTGGTFTGSITISRSSYPGVNVYDSTQGRRGLFEYRANGIAAMTNRLGSDTNNTSTVLLRKESDDLSTMLQLGVTTSGTLKTYNILHTGNVTSGTTDITAGTSALATGAQYLVYE